jgi:hypothetical protein
MAIDIPARHDFVLSRRTDTDAYGLWRVDYGGGDLLKPVPLSENAKLNKTHQVPRSGAISSNGVRCS